MLTICTQRKDNEESLERRVWLKLNTNIQDTIESNTQETLLTLTLTKGKLDKVCAIMEKRRD